MIEVKNEDFELYRKKLLDYALGLLKQRGSAGTLYSEYDEKAKDIVQECYINSFHNCKKDIFVTHSHLNNYLKLCLYNSYKRAVWPEHKENRYNIMKKSDLSLIENDSNYLYEEFVFNDSDNDFIKTLTDNQKMIVDKLSKGYKVSEIAQDEKISRQAVHYALGYIKKKYIKYEEENK